MICPRCNKHHAREEKRKNIDSIGAVRRKRVCKCGFEVTTLEIPAFTLWMSRDNPCELDAIRGYIGQQLIKAHRKRK